MGKKERIINVYTMSDYGTKVQVTMTEDTDDLTNLINKAISKIEEFKKIDKTLKIVHIDSLRRQEVPEL